MKKANKKKNNHSSPGSGIASTDLPKLPTYEEAFLQMKKTQKCGKKAIYIGPEYHDRLRHVLHILGDNKIPLFLYVNNILEHHFRMFEDDIIQGFDKKYKQLF